jgi:mannosyltransferase
VLKLLRDTRNDSVLRPTGQADLLLPVPPGGHRPQEGRGVLDRMARRIGPEALVVILGVIIFSWELGTPSPWRDESATMVIADRSVPQILKLTGSVDLVHLSYYLIAHGVLALVPGADPDTALLAVRWVSVAAVALTAGVMVRIGRQLNSAFVGTTSALLLLASPLASRYAQEARSYALIMLAASCATWALLQACGRPWRRRGWTLYGLAIGVTALLNVLSFLLLLVVHTVHVLTSTPSTVRRRWGTATGRTMTFLAPFVLMSFSQRTQVAWIHSPSLNILHHFLLIEYETLLVPLVVITIAAGALLAGALRRRTTAVLPAPRQACEARTPAMSAAGLPPLPVGPRLPVPARSAPVAGSPDRERDRAFAALLGSGPHRGAFFLGLTWSLVPPLLLWCVSQVHPLFAHRYVIFSLPGTALLLASLAPLLRPLGALLPLVAMVLSGSHTQCIYRNAAVGHGEDVRGVTRYIASHAMDSDAVLFLPDQMRLLAQQYPGRFRGLTDLAADASPVETSTIWGEERPETVLRRIEGRTRIWVIAGPNGLAGPKSQADTVKVAALSRDYRISEHANFLKFEVFLYTLVPTPSAQAPRPLSVGVPQEL